MSESPRKVRTFVHRWRSAVLNSGKHQSARLDSTSRLVCLALSEYTNTEGGDCYPSIASIADLAGVNERTARRALATIDALGWIDRYARQGDGRKWAQHGYVLTLPEGADTRPARSGRGADIPPARPRSEGAGAVSGPSQTGCGLSRRKVRTLTPKGAGALSDEQEELTGKANRKDDSVLTDGDNASTWKTALAMLTTSGLQEARARAVIGKARKILKNDDAMLSELVGIAERDRIADPGAWLLAAATKRANAPRPAGKPIAHATTAEAEAAADAALARLEVARHA